MNICIFTVILNEQDYLNDFLDYHTKMGIDIFVYEDVDSLSHKSICDKYNNVYLASILDIFPKEQHNEIIQMKKDKEPPQTLYINQGLKHIHSLNKYDWVALTDIDEYITCSEKFPDILDRYKEHQAVLLYWQNYGCSGHLYKPSINKPPYEIYTEKCGYEQYSDYKFFKITKFIVNMQKYKPEHKYWIHCANVDFVKANGTYKRTEVCLEPLYLRHYILRSAEEYCWKVWVRSCMHPGHRCWKSLKEMDGEMYERLKNEKGFRDYFKDKYGVELPPFD